MSLLKRRPVNFSIDLSHTMVGLVSTDCISVLYISKRPLSFIVRSRHAAAVWAGLYQRKEAF